MNPIVRNILAVIAGIVAGSLVNMGLIMVGGQAVPPPAGVDPTNMESLQASMHLFEPKHFLFPFLAHATGTLVGAFIAAWIAASRKLAMAFIVGCIFLLGGIANAYLLPAPVWFIALDLIVAYLPMAWLGARFAPRSSVPIRAS
ncbi:MAG: hypothetical protein WD081_04040 [Gammaproteobacteria bacterium]